MKKTWEVLLKPLNREVWVFFLSQINVTLQVQCVNKYWQLKQVFMIYFEKSNMVAGCQACTWAGSQKFYYKQNYIFWCSCIIIQWSDFNTAPYYCKTKMQTQRQYIVFLYPRIVCIMKYWATCTCMQTSYPYNSYTLVK